MRVRDTKIYILLTALVFLMVVTFNIFYISSFTTRAKELTYSDAINETKSNLISVSERIIYYEHEFETSNYTNVELIENPKDNYMRLFDYSNYGNVATALLNSQDIETINAVNKYYLYIVIDDRLGRLDLERIFEPVSKQGFYLFKGLNGEYVYSDLSYDHFLHM